MKKGRTLILLSCSRDKRSGGDPYDFQKPSILSKACLSDTSLAQLTDQRFEIFKLLNPTLYRTSTRLYNEDQKGGFRDERQCNRALRPGPDFGAANPGMKTYLPAYQRYCGRFFSQLQAESSSFWERLSKLPIDIVIVSGLYGLVLWNEQIQEYDCHVNDRENILRARTIGDIWGDPLTDVLCDYLKHRCQQAETGPVTHVYDMLSESSYQKMFDWKRIRNSGVEVLHRIFLGFAGPDILSPAAKLICREIDHFISGEQQQFGCGPWYGTGDQGDRIQFGFEYPIGSRSATREGDIDRVRRELGSTFAELRDYYPACFDQLVLAEHSLRTVEHLNDLDFSVMVVSFSKAVERFLKQVMPAHRKEDIRTLGELILELGEHPKIKHLQRDAKTLNGLRRPGAHEIIVDYTPGDAKRARTAAINILREGQRLRR